MGFEPVVSQNDGCLSQSYTLPELIEYLAYVRDQK